MRRTSARIAGKSPEQNLATPAKKKRLSQQGNNCESVLTQIIPMNRLSEAQKAQVRTFCQWTQQPEATAIACLKKGNWSSEFAMDHYYNNQALYAQSCNVDKYKLENLFTSYSKKPEDEEILRQKYPNLDPADDSVGSRRIGPHGIYQFLSDLSLPLDDRRVLIMACKMKASTQCEFTWEEFQCGFSELRVDSVETMRNKLDELDAGLVDHASFREVYNFTFNYGKQAGQRCMLLDTAITYWRILFKDAFPLLETWIDFLQKEHGMAISKDTWNLLLDFVFTIKPDLSNYDDDGAWPVLLDQFVDYIKNKMSEQNAAA